LIPWRLPAAGGANRRRIIHSRPERLAPLAGVRDPHRAAGDVQVGLDRRRLALRAQVAAASFAAWTTGEPSGGAAG
jgi:hypothetical protein